MRAVFLSDLHLGSDFIQQDLLKEFLKATKKWPYFLLGDIFDFWKPGTADPELVESLRANTLFYFPGNHDWQLQYANIVSPAVFKHRTFAVSGKTVAVTHGDIFDSSCGAPSFFNKVADRVIYRLSQLFRTDIRSKLSALTAVFYAHTGTYYDKAFNFLIDNRAKYLVYGHTHVPGIFCKDDMKLINLGSWYSRPHALFSSGGKYAFYEITKSKILPTEEDFIHLW